MYALKLLFCLCLMFCALSFGADTEVNAVRKQPPEVEADVQKVIVKFRAEGLDIAARQSDTTQAKSGKDRAVALAQRAGLTLKESHEVAAGMHALQVQTLSSGESLITTLARFGPTRQSNTPSLITGATSMLRPTTRCSSAPNGT